MKGQWRLLVAAVTIRNPGDWISFMNEAFITFCTSYFTAEEMYDGTQRRYHTRKVRYKRLWLFHKNHKPKTASCRILCVFVRSQDGFWMNPPAWFPFFNWFPLWLLSQRYLLLDRQGVGPTMFSLHSLCIGGACALRAAGPNPNPLSMILFMGRWKSLLACLSYVNEYDRAMEHLTTPGLLSIADVNLLRTDTYSTTCNDVDSSGFPLWELLRRDREWGSSSVLVEPVALFPEVASCGEAIQYWWYRLVVWCDHSIPSALILSYVLQHLRLRGGICPALRTVVVGSVSQLKKDYFRGWCGYHDLGGDLAGEILRFA